MSTIVTPGTIDTVMSATNGNYRRVAVLSPSKAIVTYRKASDSYAYARCVDMSGTSVSHPGAEVRITSSASAAYAMDIVRLTDTKAVALFAYDSTNRPIARVIDLAGSTLSTPGAETSSFVASTSGFFSGARISDSSMLAVWATGSTAKAAVLSGITASTITVNAVADVEATGITRPAISPIDATRVLLTYFQSGSLMAEILDISGTTVTGTNTAVTVDASPDTASTPEVAVLTDGLHAAIAYRKSGSLDISINILTITGSSLSAGTAVNYGTLDAYQDGYSLVPLSESNVLLAYYDYNDSWKPKAVIISALNTVLGTIATVSATGSGTDQDMDVVTTGTSLLWFTTGSNDQGAVVLSYDAPTTATNDGIVTLPMFEPEGYGGGAGDTGLPMLTAFAVAYPRDNHADLLLPMIGVEARSAARADVSLPSLTAEAAGTVVNFGRHDVSLPMLQAEASATVTTTSNAAVTLPSLSAFGMTGAVMESALPMLLMEGEAEVGAVGSADITLPMFIVEALASTQNVGRADILLPMLREVQSARGDTALPMLISEATAHFVVAVVYEAYATNLKHTPRQGVEPVNEVTRYTEFPFNQIVRWGNKTYGVADAGVYLIGTGSNAIPWAWKTALTDDKTPEKKAVRSAYFAGRVGPAANITLHLGESGDEAYTYTTPKDATPQNYRQVFGRATKARYFAIAMDGDDVLELDALELQVDKLQRKL